MSTSKVNRGKPNQGFLYGVQPWSAAIVAAVATALIGGFAGYTSSEEGPPMSALGHEERGWVRPMAIRVEAPDLYDPDGSPTEFLCEPVQPREPPPVEPPSVEARNPALLRISWPSIDENRLKERDS
jgi:hypothetical protein